MFAADQYGWITAAGFPKSLWREYFMAGAEAFRVPDYFPMGGGTLVC